MFLAHNTTIPPPAFTVSPDPPNIGEGVESPPWTMTPVIAKSGWLK